MGPEQGERGSCSATYGPPARLFNPDVLFGHRGLAFYDASDLRKRETCRRFVSNYGLVGRPAWWRSVGPAALSGRSASRVSSPKLWGRWQGRLAARARPDAV